MAEPVPSFLRVLKGERLARPPVWFMRQAGRYLPEYRDLRAQAPDFVSFCLNPEMAAEATLQPLRRFPFDAAIVFADILLVPAALGQEVRFEAGEGPRLGELPPLKAMGERAAGTGEALSAVGRTLARVRADLPDDKALIGFCGAPWTVATYMLDGDGVLSAKTGRAGVRAAVYERRAEVEALIGVLVEASAWYLKMQADAGAQVLKIFESWAEGLPDDLFEALVVNPHQMLIARLRELGVDQPLIGFPRGAAALAEDYAARTAVQAVGLDTACPLAVGRRVQQVKPVQGALDPLLLRAGGAALDRRIDAMIKAWGDGPWVFNLGHGILPETPVAHVEQALKRLGAG